MDPETTQIVKRFQGKDPLRLAPPFSQLIDPPLGIVCQSFIAMFFINTIMFKDVCKRASFVR